MTLPKLPFGSSSPGLFGEMHDKIHSSNAGYHSGIIPSVHHAGWNANINPQYGDMGFGNAFGEQSFNGHSIKPGLIDKW